VLRRGHRPNVSAAFTDDGGGAGRYSHGRAFNRAEGAGSPDRADAMAIASLARLMLHRHMESHAGESITGDLMTKAW
jgi:hypothetical protein